MYLTRSSHFPSFPHFRFAGKSFPAKNLDLISRGFDENLLTRLKPLMFSGAKTPSSISLSWLSLAIDFLSSTHNDAVTLFSDLRSSHNLDDSHGLYLDDSIKLLDLCNSISSEIEQLQKGRLLINFVLHLLDFSDEATKIPSPENLRRARNSLSDWMINNSSPELKKPNLPNAANLIRDLAVHLNNPPRGKISTVQKLIHHTTYAVVAVTVLVTSAVVSALTGSPPGTIRVRVPDRFLWSEAFNGLESAIFSQIRNNGEEKRRFIDDLDDVDRRVKSVCDVIDYLAGRDGFSEGGSGVDKRTLLNAVRELKTVAKNFSDGLDGLYNGVNVLFNTVLCTRNGVLEKFRS